MGSRVQSEVNRLLWGPRLKPSVTVPTTRMGSEYGGWIVGLLPSLLGADVLSCGLGEDASLDVELAQRFGCRLVIVDPTPRAVCHFEALTERFGLQATAGYVLGGHQPVESYELSNVNRRQMRLIEAAIWISNDCIELFPPDNPDHSSYSVSQNFQRRKSVKPISVPAVTIKSLTRQLGKRFDIIKLDIETAEMTVLPHALQSGVYPDQWLVEFDLLNQPSRHSTKSFWQVHGLLEDHNYACASFDGRSNFLYVKRSYL